MKLITIEDSVYRVTDAECEKLQQMQINDKSDQEKTMQYIDENRWRYKDLGLVHFDCRR